MPTPRNLLALLAGLAWAGLATRTLGADDEVLALPPVEVSAENLAKRPWSYWTVANLEVLSRCADHTTEAFILRYDQLNRLWAHLLPAEVTAQFTVPTAFLLADRGEASQQTQELIASADGKTGQGGGSSRRTVRTLPNLDLRDLDRIMVFGLLDEWRFDAATLQFTQKNIQQRLVRCQPAPPPWFVVGVQTLYEDINTTGEEIKIDPASWCPPDMRRQIEDNGNTPRDLVPLARLFEAAPPPPGETPARAAWRAQAALLYRWALDGEPADRRAGFFRLVTRAAREPLTEAACRAELGLDYEQLGAALRRYLPHALRFSLTLQPAPSAPKVAPIGRLATRAEIARLKGEWERLTIAYVKERQPDYIEAYVAQARSTLSRAYEKGERDPAFLAVAGLFACDVGEFATARPYLENAVKQGVVRPRIYWELARLRYQDALAHPYEPDGKLASNQVEDILGLLRKSQAWQPALRENYVLSLQTWLSTRAPVPPEEFARLHDGLKHFPREAFLYTSLAMLHLQNNQLTAARQLLAEGRRVVPAGPGKDTLERLQQSLDRQLALRTSMPAETSP